MDLKQSLNKMYSTDHNVGAEESETGHHDSLRLPQNISCRQSGLFRLYLIVTIPFDIFLPCQTGPLLASDSDLDYCSKLPLQVFSAVCAKYVGLGPACHDNFHERSLAFLLFIVNYNKQVSTDQASLCRQKFRRFRIPHTTLATLRHGRSCPVSKGTSISSKGIVVFDL